MTASVVIPTLNEAARLPALIATLREERPGVFVVVADGGSADATVAVARGLGLRVVHSDVGRGRQLAAGASAAPGEVLLFLHADSRFPPGGLAQIEAMLAAHPDAPGGNFRLIFDGDDRFSRWLTGFYAWLRRRGLFYGDSAIFVRRAAYDALGGFRPIAIMEDYDFVRRLKRLGPLLCIEAPAMVTSSRRFRGRHPVSIVLGWLWLHALFHLRVSPDRLADIYDSRRQRTQS